ncbi:MAG: hypothetical protein AB8I69_16790 [Anaerolineae bacterium]|jgi:hypothetical protein
MRAKIWIAITLLVVASMACSLGGKVESVPEAETAIPTEIGDVGGETPSEDIDAEDLSGLESYRMRTVAQWTPEGDAPQEGFSMEMEYTKNPPASRMVMENEGGKIEWVQIEDTTWLCQAGTCAQYAGSAEDVASTFGAFSLDPTSLTADSDSEYVGRETVNGINARHYALKLNALQVTALAQGDVTDIHSDAWIADESSLPAFVTRYTLTWKETRGEQKGTYEYTYDVYDVNAAITIEPPEGATGFPEGVPAYPGAKDLFIIEGMITFSTSDDVATVADFYRSELAAKGWTKTSDEEMAGLIQQVWNKDEQTLSLMLSPAEDSGGTSVIISIE